MNMRKEVADFFIDTSFKAVTGNLFEDSSVMRIEFFKGLHLSNS